MAKLKAILVDDEESARNVLFNLLKRSCPNLEIVASCENVPEAVKEIKRHQPDLLFLDIEMPEYAGYEIVDFFDEINFEIIFTTAYDQYAIKAFEISAIDYILKPINRQRLIESVKKASEKIGNDKRMEQLNLLVSSMKDEEVSRIVISELGNKRVIEINNILAIEAQGAYSIIHLKNEKEIIASKNLKHFENLLEEAKSFFRSHKSWIINKTEVRSIQSSKGTIELNGGIEAKLSKYKVEEFNQII